MFPTIEDKNIPPLPQAKRSLTTQLISETSEFGLRISMSS